MSMNELATIRQHNIPVKIILMSNGLLGMVYSIQRSQYHGRRMAVELSGSPDFGKIAEAYGMEYAFATDLRQAEQALERMLASPESCLLECAIHPEEETT